MTAIKQGQQMEEVQRWEDVPAFTTEDDERTYWDTHTLSDELLAEMAEGSGDPRLPAPRGHGRTQPISVRLDPDLLQRVKDVARARNVRYQTLLKQWIAERLAVEETPTGGKPPVNLPGVGARGIAFAMRGKGSRIGLEGAAGTTSVPNPDHNWKAPAHAARPATQGDDAVEIFFHIDHRMAQVFDEVQEAFNQAMDRAMRDVIARGGSPDALPQDRTGRLTHQGRKP
jgi:hypothetical protein